MDDSLPLQAGPVHGQFDAGARFSALAPPSIPPPPPGVAPTPAQLAAMQGQQVRKYFELLLFLKIFSNFTPGGDGSEGGGSHERLGQWRLHLLVRQLGGRQNDIYPGGIHLAQPIYNL